MFEITSRKINWIIMKIKSFKIMLQYVTVCEKEIAERRINMKNLVMIFFLGVFLGFFPGTRFLENANLRAFAATGMEKTSVEIPILFPKSIHSLAGQEN